jgi:vacuolar-type H+-ATPase subunit H
MANNVIQKIKEAELAADKTIKNAQEKAHKITFETKLEIEELALSAETTANLEAENIREHSIGTANGEVKKIKEDAENQKALLRKIAAQNIDKAINMVSEEAKRTWA